MNDCCTTGFLWDGIPTGREGTFGDQRAYIAGDSTKRAVFIIHDALGWKLNNTRLLADHYAKEVGATVYLPDFFDDWAVGEKDISIKIEDGKATIARNEDFDWNKWFTVNGRGEVSRCPRFCEEAAGGVFMGWRQLASAGADRQASSWRRKSIKACWTASRSVILGLLQKKIYRTSAFLFR